MDPGFPGPSGRPNLSAKAPSGGTMKSVLVLCLVLCSSAALAAGKPGRAAAPAAAPACDRECLRGKLSEVLYALADHDVGKLAVAPDLRVTEDGAEKALAKVG